MKYKFINIFSLMALGIILSLTLLTYIVFKEKKEKSLDTIVIGLDDTFVPLGFRDNKGTLVGFDIDLAKEALKSIGYKVIFQPIDWTMKEAELNSHNIDMIWNGYTKTEKREKQVSFSNGYLKNKQVIVVLKDSSINTKKDLKEKVVAVQNGSSSQEVLRENKALTNTFKNQSPILFDTNNEAFMDLEEKRSDALVCDEILAKYYISKKGNNKFKILKEDLGDEIYSVGLRKEDKALKNQLNKALKSLKDNGILKKISYKWFKEDLT